MVDVFPSSSGRTLRALCEACNVMRSQVRMQSPIIHTIVLDDFAVVDTQTMSNLEERSDMEN